MRNVRCEVAYDGSRFYGWQRQDGFESVQGALEDGLAALLDTVISVQGAGRTDTGVHALRQVAHFHVDTRLDDDRLRHALNAHLAEGVVVRRHETCAADFHAPVHSTGKRYLDRSATTRVRPPDGRA
jgi:tRNA pseudouridine38-40 synthase